MSLNDRRLVAQRTMFAPPFSRVPQELYVRVESGQVEASRNSVSLDEFTRISTNTYFGRFPASYWQRWTDVREVRFSADIRGSGEVKIFASDLAGKERVVECVKFEESEWVHIEHACEIDRFVDGGALWMESSTRTSSLEIRGANWSVPGRSAHRPAAIAMPTFNRVDFCVETLSCLASDPEALASLEAIYLVDQGSVTVEDHPQFQKIEEDLCGKLSYIRQPNLGGAGGYGRGLYEVTEIRKEDHANVLFMDDDIWLEPDIVIRLNAFANCTSAPVIVGGQMLCLLHPDKLHVGAEAADLATLTPGLAVPNALVSASMTQPNVAVSEKQTPTLSRTAFAAQDIRVDGGYNGWWSCLIPSEVAKSVGYPLPMFFQWDDVEYAYRAKSEGFPTVTLPGAGVWHADFDWKDWDDWHRYFNLRNSLITASLHSNFKTRQLSVILLEQLFRYLVSMQYGLAATLVKSIDDFLVGPDILADGGVQAAAHIRKLRSAYPETERHSAVGLRDLGLGASQIAVSPPPPSLKRATFVKRLISHILGRVDGTAAVPAGDANWWHVSRFRIAIVTDASQEHVRVRRFNRAKLRILALQGIRACWRLRRQGAATAGAYRRALPMLSSRENWARLYTDSLVDGVRRE